MKYVVDQKDNLLHVQYGDRQNTLYTNNGIYPQQVQEINIIVQFDLNQIGYCFASAYKCYTLKVMSYFHCTCQCLVEDYWCY